VQLNLEAGHTFGQAGVANVPGATSVGFDVTNPDVAKWINQYTIKLAGNVNAYTTRQISATLAEGMDKGETVSEMARRVKDEFTAASDTRATTIARTESGRAYVEGQKKGWEDSGVVQGMRWELASEACPICNVIAKQYENKTVPLNGSFYKLGQSIPLANGGVFVVDYSDITGAPAHVNCRCNCTPVLIGENE